MQILIQKKYNFLLIATLLLGGPALRADVPSELEPRFADAVLAYRQSQASDALQKLNALLKEAPGTIEFLELKALALKSTKDDRESSKTYAELIRQKLKARAPKKELAPYYFELGLIRFREKDFSKARENLELALAESFNSGPANYFLGMIYFQLGSLDQAAKSFQNAIDSGVSELAPVSYFFMAQVNLKASFPSGAIENFTKAKEISQKILDKTDAPASSKETAKQIFDAATRALDTLDRNTWFGSVALIPGYDSNVLTYPKSIAQSSATDQKTAKIAYQAAIGYATSPIRAFQWVPSYRLVGNYNFNRNSRSGEYATNILSLSGNRRPLERTVFGFRLELPCTFQNQPDSSIANSKYRVLNFGASVGPTFRRQFNSKLTGTAESVWGYLRYPGDPSASSEAIQRSGMTSSSRAGLAWDNGSRWFNPGFHLSFQNTKTKGNEYKVRTYGASLQNSLNVIENVRLMTGVSASYSHYYARTPSIREDNTIVAFANGLWNLNKKFSITADASYTNNGSNEATTYEYNRVTFAAGLSYNFF